MVVVIWSPIAIALGRLYEGIAPHIPGSETSITSFKPGDFALFAAAGISYVWLYQQNYSVRYRNLVTLFGALGLLVGATQNRGGLLGGLVMIALASVYLSPEMRRRFLASGSLAVAALIVVVAVANVALPLGSRAFSAEQLAENTVSLFGASEDEGLEGTVSWRLAYWDLVVGDVIAGGEWLTGKGFGTNLADTYGYQVAAQDSSQPLRNAHNSHITIVARLGLIGFFLWMAFWFQTALRLNRRERRQGHVLMKFLLPIMLAFGVSAVFDPLFEGPQMAIPFWFAAGIATGSMFLQRAAVVRRRFRSG